MGSTKASTWIAGTAVLAILILVAAWFLLISPVRATALETSETAESQDERNALEQVRIDGLAKQFAELDSYKATLASLRQQIPVTPNHGEFQSELATIAAAHSVTIASLTVNASSEIVVAGAEPAAAPAGTEAAEGEDAAAPAAPSNLFTGFYQIPADIEVVGTYQNVLAFVSDLQTVNTRLFLVTGLSGTGLKEGEGSGGLPPTAAGDLNLVINGQMYVVLDPNAAPSTDDPAAETPLPVPAPEKNPLILTP
ncbi:hypothetical protein [Sanguibacter sp. 25GB23B1]|uniref:hypothetical protein n=1 Tax=unclassified Sanguibacter TaxID=2645534 RepID=UPI0032AF1FD6